MARLVIVVLLAVAGCARPEPDCRLVCADTALGCIDACYAPATCDGAASAGACRAQQDRCSRGCVDVQVGCAASCPATAAAAR